MSKQEKLRELADRIDHDKLWRQPAMDRDKLTQDQRDRLDAGVMLRRYSDILEPGRWLVIPPTGSVQFSGGTLDKAFEMAKRDEGRKAASEAAKATGTAGELFGYGSSEKKNCLLSKAQYENCAPKNRTAYDIPLYAYSLPKCENCKGYGVITHVSGQTPDNYEECNEVCPDCEGEGAARQPAPVSVQHWQDRLPLCPSKDQIIDCMQSEIFDLRAALEARSQP